MTIEKSSEQESLNYHANEKDKLATNKFPTSIYFILFYQILERFSFYSIKNSIITYLRTAYGLQNIVSKSQYHIFFGLYQLFPIVGAILSDSYLGKYKTILYMSIVYLVGILLMGIFSINNLVASFGSYPSWTYILPITLIIFGGGCIVPCIYTYGGDQIQSQSLVFDKYSSLYYLISIIGGIIPQYLISYINFNVICFGSKCYFLSYCLCVIALFIGLVLLSVGKKYSAIVPPAGKFMPWVVIKVIITSIYNYIKANPVERSNKKHWLEFSSNECNKEMVEEVRLFIKSSIMLLPTIFWWTLYNQYMVEWQDNYELMNHNYFNSFYVATELSSMTNTVLVIFFLPILSFIVYPILEKYNINLTLIKRIQLGWLLVILSFIYSNSMQYYVVANASSMEMQGFMQISCDGCVNGSVQIVQYILLTLGEALFYPSCLQFAYTQVGKHMKASSILVMLCYSFISSYFTLAIEFSSLSNINSFNKMWIYISISIFFFLVFIVMDKYWFISKEDKDIQKNDELNHKEVFY